MISMLIEVNTDNHIQGRADISASVQSIIASGLDHFSDRISRVEVHLADENGEKGGDADLRCSLEARIEGLKPVAASNLAGSLEEAIEGAVTKLSSVLEHTLGRLRDKRPKLDGSAADVADLLSDGRGEP
jgi:hypothetical protein